MMDDKDGRGDIPDKLRFDIRAYAWGLLFDPSQFVSDTLHLVAGDKWRRCVCMNIIKPYRETRARVRAQIRVRSRAAAAAAATIL